jgi:hypothetical protein
VSVKAVSFEHLLRLSDDNGLFEHAEITQPRSEHGYCVDDVARGLVVVVREPDPPEQLLQLAAVYLKFVCSAQVEDGRFHNRRGMDPHWTDDASVQDCWGRALWGLGSVVARCPALAEQAEACFDLGATRRSPWVRAMAFAALGAAEVLSVNPDHDGARALLADAAELVGRPGADPNWRWCEPRLHYANAVLPETLLAAGSLLNLSDATQAGLRMLDWLLEIETRGSHLSVTPVGGWALHEPRPGFDQQPIEIAALADACDRAFQITGQPQWRNAVLRCAAWFTGENDSRIALLDPVSGGGCDGLEADGRNENQGAESTLAMISTLQHAHRVCTLPRVQP